MNRLPPPVQRAAGSRLLDIGAEDLRRLQAGDVRALGACYEAFGARVWRVARALLGSAAEADDATQEVFLRVLEKAPLFDGRSRFSTWIHRLSVNHCKNRRERERAHRSRQEALSIEEPACSGPSPLELAADDDERAHLFALLARLPEEQRAVLVLREVEGLAYREIADALEIPAGTVMSRLARARERLLLELGPTSKEVPRATARSGS